MIKEIKLCSTVKFGTADTLVNYSRELFDNIRDKKNKQQV